MKMKVRFMRWGDLDEVRTIVSDEFPSRQSEVKRWMDGIEGNMSLMIAAFCDTHLVGFAGLQYIAEQDVIFHSDCVRISARKQGVGSTLVLSRIAFLNDEVVTPYSGGIIAIDKNMPFYQRFGFSAIGTPEYDPVFRLRLCPMERFIATRDILAARDELKLRDVHLALDEIPEEN